jgi:hypothetical protein
VNRLESCSAQLKKADNQERGNQHANGDCDLYQVYRFLGPFFNLERSLVTVSDKGSLQTFAQATLPNFFG